MSLKNICNLIDNYDIVLVAYENEKEKSIKQILKEIKNNYSKEIKIAVLIGPEGGIAPEEIEALTESGAMTMSLGNSSTKCSNHYNVWVRRVGGINEYNI